MLTAKELNQKIAGIRKSSDAIRRNIHEVLCNAAGHAYEHGDVTYFTKLIQATTGVNQKRIMGWIRDNGFATWNKEKNCYTVNKSARADADFADGHEVAMHLFTEVDAWYVEAEKPSDIAKELDLVARIKSLRAQSTKGDKVIKVDFAALKSEMEGLLEDIQKMA